MGGARSAGSLARHLGRALAEGDRSGEEHLVEALAGRDHGQADVRHLVRVRVRVRVRCTRGASACRAGTEGLVAASSWWGCWLGLLAGCRLGLQAGVAGWCRAQHAEADQGGTHHGRAYCGPAYCVALLVRVRIRTTRKSTRIGPVALTKRSTAPGSSSTVEQRKDSMPYDWSGWGQAQGQEQGSRQGQEQD